MIFSVGEHSESFVTAEREMTDIFCFFHSENSINIPKSSLVGAVLASLKNKKFVLVLEKPHLMLPFETSTKQLVIGEHYLWLAPHAQSVFLLAAKQNSVHYGNLKQSLL
jgi:hypothetical protein